MKRDIEYKSLKHDNTYGSLALDNFWVDEEQEVVVIPKQKHKKYVWKKPSDLFKKFRKENANSSEHVKQEKIVPTVYSVPHQLKLVGITIGAVFFAAAFVCVMLSQMIMVTQQELVRLQRQEKKLISMNSELKIAVEELKGPDRIRDIAINQLGMMVARENVYVHASKAITVGEQYGRVTADEEKGFLAMIGK